MIAGHFGWAKGIPAVFDNLHKLRPADKRYVTDSHGAIVTFVVRESRAFVSSADATSVFQSTDGKSRLNLITCEGWSSAFKSYTQWLVVFADKL